MIQVRGWIAILGCSFAAGPNRSREQHSIILDDDAGWETDDALERAGRFLIVCVGAYAGGIEAREARAEGSADLEMVFLAEKFVIRGYTRALTEIFTTSCRATVDARSPTSRPADAAKPRRGRCRDHVGQRHVRAVDRPRKGRCLLPGAARALPRRREPDRRVVVRVMDVTVLAHAEMSQCVLVLEPQHRTRNLLDAVQSIARQTPGEGIVGRGLSGQAEGARSARVGDQRDQ